jgi:hypothetical protein
MRQNLNRYNSMVNSLRSRWLFHSVPGYFLPRIIFASTSQARVVRRNKGL